jgi:hypothetical protein
VFRESLVKGGLVAVRDFTCPEGWPIGVVPLRGLGDVVARVTSAVGIKPCGGCKDRQEKLNKLVPFGS